MNFDKTSPMLFIKPELENATCIISNTANFHSRYSCMRFVYLREVCLVSRAVIGHLFYRMAREADLARLIPRAKGAQSDWRETVTLGCPRVQRAQSD
jgi:hypothetical protein